ncbi:MAG: ABC transporter ATP-binding protein [Bacteroidetes bacterium]|nr:ABC transporter ATP-binding protein [Bacteroidota bacterium]
MKTGTRLGIVGANGAGKSSLLRLMAGVFEPTKGNITRSGKIVTLFDLHFGMDEEASGYKNIEIGATLLEIDAKQIQNIIPQIEEFSGLGDALHRPIKSYSTGMRMRLAFSLITSIEADCLLIDEIIGVGDRDFLEKARTRLKKRMNEANIVVLASHVSSILREFCTSGIVLDHGKIVFRGNMDDTIAYYEQTET